MKTLVVTRIVLAAAVACVGLSACVEQPHRRYESREVVYQQSPRGCGQCGVVDDIQQVYVRKQSSPGGAILGAVIGGVLGSTVGHGDGRTAATVGGAVAGGFVGNAVGKNQSGDDVAFQTVVRLDDGRTATVTQREDPQVRQGDYVEVRDGHVFRR